MRDEKKNLLQIEISKFSSSTARNIETGSRIYTQRALKEG
jgi:hypothetical protein